MNFEDITNRLASLGYAYDEQRDSWILGFLIDKVTNHICNNCNLSEIPTGLYEKAVDVVCAEFIKGVYSQNKGLIDVDSAVTSIREGDTTVNFASGSTPEEIYLKYLDTLVSDTIDFARYRKMNWN
jgi:hypothetical protein